MEMELLKLLSAGGDVATIALVAFLWKLERRVFKLELNRKNKNDS